MTQMTHPRVSTGALNIARSDLAEQLGERVLIGDPARNQTSCMQIAALRLRDQWLRELPELLRLCRRRLDTTMQEQRRRQVAHHRVAVLGRAIELPALLTVIHLSPPSG